MSQPNRDRAAVTVLTAIGAVLGHHGGDFLVQTDCMAAGKREHTPHGRRALARHAVSYAGAQAVTKAALYGASGVRVPVAAQLAGAVVEGVLHALIDDARLLQRLARSTGKARFHDVAPGGRMHMDQAAHMQVQILAGTVTTALIAARRHRSGRDDNGR
ncbi:MAG: DUF3307 domain-containing protein [Pseudonocardia sp.]|nr:DUF3307 domain-containing protein [Pseudonocardia sp.]